MPQVSSTFSVSTKTTGAQTRPESATLSDGRIVVTWQDANTSAFISDDIRARIFNPDGIPAGDDFIVNSEVGEEHGPYSNGNQHLFYHRQTAPSVAALTDGGFAVIYNDGRATTNNRPPFIVIDSVMVVQRFNADGSKNGVDAAINPAIENNGVQQVGAFYSDIIGTVNGGYVAAFGTQVYPEALQTTADDEGIVLEAFNAAGTSAGFVQANATTTNRQERPELARLTDGSVVAVWGSNTHTGPGSGYQLKAQRFDEATGAKIGGEISFLQEFAISFAGAGPFHDVVGLAGGGFAVTWAQMASDFNSINIRFQLVGANGVLQGGIQNVTADLGVGRTAPSIAAGSDGGFLIAWNTYVANFPNGEIWAQAFKADGSSNGDLVMLSGSAKNADAAAMANGSYLVTWEDNTSLGGSDFDVLGAIVTPETTITGTTGPDALAGSTGPNIINGLAGNDQLFGLAGNDTLNGDAGQDILYGGAGNDSMLGGTGDDQYVLEDTGDRVVELLDEGDDTIFVGVSDFVMGPHIEIARMFGAAASMTGSASAEQIVANAGIASLLRGEGGNDVLWGGSLAHTLEGGEGDDVIRGQDGPVRMVGGTGNDSFVVGNLAAVIVELAGGGDDTVYVAVQDYVMPTEVEVAYLSGDATRLTGSATSEQLVANPGAASRLTGEGGDDTLWGSVLADTMLGGTGDDIMRGQGGDDQMTGGTGNDQYVVFSAAATITELTDGGFDIAYIAGAGAFFIGENVEQGLLLGAGNHVIGNALGNLLAGNSSGIASTIDAGGGADLIFGTAAGDTIIGGTGDDTIYTYGGADRLVYAAPGWGTDVIAGFVPGEGGRLQFRASSGVTSFDQFAVISANGNTQISHANGAVLLFGVASLSAADFIFG